jgi:ABC-type glycerol-3-phosphate transport system substrate-binding protein
VEDSKKLSRRELLRYVGFGSAAIVVAACQPRIVEVEKVVTKIVKEVVKETIVVAGTPEVVEREVTKIVKEVVKETVVVEKIVEVEKAAPEKIVVRHNPQGLYPSERLEGDRWDPPMYYWTLEKRYEDAHPDVDIQFIEIPSGTVQDEWITTQMVAGTAPELFWIQRGWVNRDYKKGWYVNLTPYLNEKNPYAPDYDSWYDTFQTPVIDSGRAPDGNIYMITADIVGTGQFYNVDMFNEVGVSPPKDWADFLVMQKKIQDAGHIPFSMSMEIPGGVGLWGSWCTREIQDVLYDHKMGIINDNKGGTVERTWKPGENLQQPIMCRAIRDGRYGAKDPEFGEMLRILKEWSQYWPEGFWAVPSDDVYRLWVTQECAMGWFGSWLNKAVFYDPLREFEWGILPNLPIITKETSEFGGVPFPAMAGVGGVFQIGFSEAARKRGTLDATMDWMRFVTAPTQLIPLLNDHGGFAPGVKDTSGADPKLEVYVDQMAEYGTERMEPFDSMLTREFLDFIWAELQKFLAGETEREEMQDSVQEKMEEAAAQLLAENPEWAEAP